MKAKILKIGDVDKEGIIQNWTMDCEGKIPAITQYPDGSVLFCGYSIDELREISSRKAEFDI